MNLDDPFPLELVSPRVRNTILREFHGRCPSIRQMAQMPDKHLLATPGIGSTYLKDIRSVTADQSHRTAAHSSMEMADVELLERIEFIQRELDGIVRMLKGRMIEVSRTSA